MWTSKRWIMRRDVFFSVNNVTCTWLKTSVINIATSTKKPVIKYRSPFFCSITWHQSTHKHATEPKTMQYFPWPSCNQSNVVSQQSDVGGGFGRGGVATHKFVDFYDIMELLQWIHFRGCIKITQETIVGMMWLESWPSHCVRNTRTMYICSVAAQCSLEWEKTQVISVIAVHTMWPFLAQSKSVYLKSLIFPTY